MAGLMLFARPRLELDAHAWPEMELFAATILLEAGGEPPDGQVAVAWTIRSRMDRRRQGLADVILAPWQFSCWNTDAVPMRRARLGEVAPALWARCWEVATGVYWRRLDDPSGGADHYLNPQLTRKISGGVLPRWYDAAKITARIGAHEFLRL